jgi:hypothetical protein
MEFVPENNSETDSDDETTEIPTPVVLEDKYMKLSERFDQHKLNHILQNQDEFKKQMRPSCFENDYNPFTILNKYLMKSQNGTLETKYKQNNGRGRFHAIKSLSLQSMPREVRHTLAREFYIDIDIVNAHPNILLHLCKQKDLFPKILKKYCKSRDKMLEKFKVDRDTAKTVILSMINGGKNAYDSLAYKPAFLKEFKKEINILHKMFSTEDAFDAHVEKRESNGITNNHKASYMNTLLCDFENKILQTMYEYFKKPTDAVLCFDGIMLRKGEYDLKGCEKYIYEMIGIKIDLKEKPMTEGFEIGEIPSYEEPKTSLYTDFESFVNKEIYVNTLDEWCQNSIVLINNGGNHFFLTKNQRIDVKTKEVSIYYKQVSEKTIMSNLRVSTSVINEQFDYEFYQANCDKKFTQIKMADRIKMLKYTYSFIGPNLPLQGAGYLDNAIKKRTMRSENNVEFYPYLRKLGEPTLYDCFSIFTGFPFEDIPLTMTDKFENSLLYKHIGDEMMNGELGEMAHFLDHIADMIQMPHLIRGPSHLFYTSPGMGKGMMAVFMGRLLGRDHVITFGDISTYFSNFNSEQANKILKIFEEVSDKGDAFHKHDRLKGDQTKTHDRIEPKGIDAYSIRHCARYWYYTNNENALFIENNDRRHTLHRANNRMANNTEYFNTLWPLVKDESFCRMAFEYFSERKYTEKSVLTAFDTKYKNEQKISNIPNGIKFIIELIESNFEGIVRTDDNIPARDLTRCFKEWCQECGTKYSLNAFKSQIRKIGMNDPVCIRINRKQLLCYTINVDVMRTTFREYLKNNNFDFNIRVNDTDDDDE